MSKVNNKYDVAVITISDKGSRGEREDKGGPLICQLFEEAGYNIAFTEIIPDDQYKIENTLKKYADYEKVALIATTGGTGFAERDVTPEATLNVIDKRVPGIPEAMRLGSLKFTQRAMLSRMEAGIRGRSLIINLPGSPKAIKENLDSVMDALDHGIEMLVGKPRDCADDRK